MKHAKMLGLAAIAAMSLMAVVGAGTASARICSTSGAGVACGTGHGFEYVTGTFHADLAAGANTTFTSGFITVTCTTSTAHGEVTNAGTGTADIDALTFANCTDQSGNACTASSTASGTNKWHTTITSDGSGTNGTMVMNNVTLETNCAGVSCKYMAAEAGSKGEIVVTGSDTDPKSDATKVPLTKDTGSNFLCSSTATWSWEYTFTTPTSLFIT
jgi:hypothetical protein